MNEGILSSRTVSCGGCAAAGSVSVQAEPWREHLESQRGKQCPGQTSLHVPGTALGNLDD